MSHVNHPQLSLLIVIQCESEKTFKAILPLFGILKRKGLLKHVGFDLRVKHLQADRGKWQNDMGDEVLRIDIWDKDLVAFGSSEKMVIGAREKQQIRDLVDGFSCAPKKMLVSATFEDVNESIDERFEWQIHGNGTGGQWTRFGLSTYGMYDLRLKLYVILYAWLRALGLRPEGLEVAGLYGFSSGHALKRFHDIMKPSQSYPVALISADVCGSSELVERHSEEVVQETLLNFRRLLQRIVGDKMGDEFHWGGDGGEFLFHGGDYRRRAVTAAILCYKHMDDFNHNPKLNLLKEHLVIRIACHDGLMIYQEQADNIYAKVINEVVHLQKHFTLAGELIVTKPLLRGLPSTLAAQFIHKERLKEYAISLYSPISTEHPSVEQLRQLRTEVKKKVEAIEDILSGGFYLEDQLMTLLKKNLSDVYTELDNLIHRFKSVDARLGKSYLTFLNGVVGALTSQESRLFSSLRKIIRFCPKDEENPVADALVAQIKSVASRRAESVLALESLLGEIEYCLKGKRAKKQQRQFKKALAAYLKADALERETCLLSVLQNGLPLIRQILERNDEKSQKIIDCLWRDAELVFHKLKRTDGEQDQDEQVFSDARFRAVSRLLGREHVYDLLSAKDTFREERHDPDHVDLDILWRSLLVGHAQEKTRKTAVTNLVGDSLWHLAARQSTPIEALKKIACRLRNLEDVNRQKIFFDCIYGRVCVAIANVKSIEDAKSLARLIATFQAFPFLVEDAYFERYDEMLHLFQEMFKVMEVPDLVSQDFRNQLRKAREKGGLKKGDLPDTKGIPLPVQRKLAGQAPYLMHFLGHTDSRIALETLKHINLYNIHKVLKRKDINADLYTALCEGPEYFTRPAAAGLAIAHPKCRPQFAMKHLPVLGRSAEGKRILGALKPNSEVKPVVERAKKAWLKK